MAGVYSNNISPYDVKGGFTKTFGNDPNWWLTFIIVLIVLILMELIFKSTRRYLLLAAAWPPWKRGWWRRRERTAEELDVTLWQEIEKDKGIQRRLGMMAFNLGGPEHDGDVIAANS